MPHTGVVALDQPGWVMLCSDGLWNYCSDPTELSALVESTVADRPGEPAGAPDRAVDPAALAEALVAWAVEQGGHDNITVALARFDPVAAVVGDPDDESGDRVDGVDATPREEPEQAGV